MATIAEKSRTKEIIDRLQAIIDNASPVPLASGKVTIYKDEMQSLLIELASQMEIELKTYHEVNDRKGKIINEAKKEAEKIIFQAEHTASRMRVNKRVTNVPPIDYDMLTEEERSALGNANEIYGASLIYTDEMLTEVNNLISDMYQNIRSDYEIILQTLEEKMNTVAANRAELMDGLQEMDTDDRSQQILEIGQLLSNELFNARMKGRVNPDEYDDGSIQLSLDLQEEQEEKARLAEEKAQMAEAALAQMKAERDALAETVTKMKQEGVGAALRGARTAPVGAVEMAGKTASLTGGVSAADMEKFVSPREGTAKIAGTVSDKDKVHEQQEDDEEYEIVYVTEDELEEGEEYEIEYVEEDELEEGEEYETVYVEEDELEEGEEYETVYVTEDELEEGEEYEIEYVEEYETEESEKVKTGYLAKEESGEKKEYRDEPEKNNEEKNDWKLVDSKQAGSEKREVKEAIRELEAMENESKEIPLIPHFKKSEKIASAPSEKIAKMATAITTEKKYSGLISRAVSEREKTEAAVTVEQTNSIPIQSKKEIEKTRNQTGHKNEKQALDNKNQGVKKSTENVKDQDIKTDKEGNEYVQATMKFDEDFEIMEF